MADINSRKESLEDDISVHLFSVSAAMVGVCLTVIGLFRISDKLRTIGSIGDELLAIDAVSFLASCTLSYIALRTRTTKRKYVLERLADWIFLVGLSFMAIVCSLIAYEFI